jgi:hypothetical protein
MLVEHKKKTSSLVNDDIYLLWFQYEARIEELYLHILWRRWAMIDSYDLLLIAMLSIAG